MTKREELEQTLAGIVGEYEQSVHPFSSGSREYKAWERKSLDRILAALAEPSEEMLNAGKEQMPVENDCWQENGMLHCEMRDHADCVQPESVWQAMFKRIGPIEEK